MVDYDYDYDYEYDLKPGHHSELLQTYSVRPQHDPGPAHPEWPGACPQQAVSPGPGNAWGVFPVRLLVADMSL